MADAPTEAPRAAAASLAKSSAAIPAPTTPPTPGKAIVAPNVVGTHSRESIWTLRRALPRAMQLPFALALPALVIIVWCALTVGAHLALPPLFLPSPSAVLRALCAWPSMAA